MPSPILDINAFKVEFDPLLACEFDRHIARAKHFTSDRDCVELLTHSKEIAMAGGKRIRPYVAYLMYATAGGNLKDVLETVVAFEIFHTFALVHDDIIDRGAMRHGRPSLHEFSESFVSGSPDKVRHLGEGLALLVGDLTFSWSRETFARSQPSREAQALFDDMIYAVVLGQMLDVKVMCQPNPTEAMILEKTFLKTAEYTFVYPMCIGAALAGSGETYKEWCSSFGTSLGIAFQVQDDLLDITGHEAVTGKKTFQDMAEGQHTVFTAYVRSHGTEPDQEKLTALFGHTIDRTSSTELKDIFERSGALAYGRELIATEIAKARAALGELAIEADAKSAWEELITRMERRSA